MDTYNPESNLNIHKLHKILAKWEMIASDW